MPIQIDGNTQIIDASVGSAKLATMTADRNFGSNKALAVANATARTDGPNYGQLLDLIEGRAVKDPAKAAVFVDIGGVYTPLGGTEGSGSFAGSTNTPDGVVMAAGDRLLVAGQADPKQNGIYVADGAGGYERAADFAQDIDIQNGMQIAVEAGGTNGDSWYGMVDLDQVINTDNLVIAAFGSATVYTADGATLDLTANQFSVLPDGIDTNELADDSVTTIKILFDAVTEDKRAPSGISVTAGVFDGVNTVFTLNNTFNTDKTTPVINGLDQHFSSGHFALAGVTLTLDTAYPIGTVLAFGLI